VIVVLGRPTLAAAADEPASEQDQAQLVGRAAEIALGARAAGAEVQLVGAIPDDQAGDAIVLALGHAGIGHAALLRDPAARLEEGRPARLDAGDVSLGLSYVADCRVLVVAEPLPADALAVAADAASYHGAHLVAVLQGNSAEPNVPLPGTTTLLREPSEENRDSSDADDFAAAIGRYAAELDRGTRPADAFRAALGAGWERVSE
jgi:hypothetical protein